MLVQVYNTGSLGLLAAVVGIGFYFTLVLCLPLNLFAVYWMAPAKLLDLD